MIRLKLGQNKGSQIITDATFKVVSKPFVQMFSIHGFIKGAQGHFKQVPVAFALMSRRRTRDYEEVLQSVRNHLPDDIPVRKVVLDFEAGMWNASLTIIGDIKQQGCLFHFTQCIFRHVHRLSLKHAYREVENIRRYIRKLMSLPFLPADTISDAFDRLRAQQQQPEL